MNDFGASFDLSALGLLPPDWSEQVMSLAGHSARLVHLDGSSETSLEPRDSRGTDYEVVPGDVIHRHMDWLYSLYTCELLRLASLAIGLELVPANNLRYGVNINKLSGIGSRYEWHVDSNPVTGVLFVTSHPSEEGGELILRLGDGDFYIPPISGHLFVFRADEIPHAVAPLKRSVARLTIPMSYFELGQPQVVDLDLEEYLFGLDQDRT